MIGILLGTAGVVVIAVAIYGALRRWRAGREAAWELERATWREWITRP